jgi:mevalonate kinase
LSIPYPLFSARLVFPENEDPSSSRNRMTSNHQLFQFYKYLTRPGDPKSQIIDFERFHLDLEQGLSLQSTIPAGYGLGSSGALVAAVFERFARHLPSGEEIATDEGMSRLKTVFSEMESFFHGRSSGFDPLVSFLKTPLLLRSGGVPELTSLSQDFSAGGSGIFLLDTRQTGKTAPLVKSFLNKFKPEGKITEEGKTLTGMVDNLVHSFLDFSDDRFWKSMKLFSHKQVEEFSPMIPEGFFSIWAEGIETGLFYLKICGSGGGGNLIGFARDLKKATEFLRKLGYNPVFI